MKLKQFQYLDGYSFELAFENGQTFKVNLQDLIGQYVSPDQVKTAKIDPEWGCLEFNDGKADVEPKTLYQFALKTTIQHAA
ncbi:DUF2442 domain-containing protein [Methylomonas sp. HW2-6]|uniref:DUF2442 domain-containing protein n=1 Tax=Methylomonas TaxID=416 RepID=UPI00112E9A68|nr:DUF2442 domain-containing protein [Methylomonas koyamae]TPQ24836.1 hypothetical protein C2U68_17560 [Methylomonas koyamae]